jgi:hypothetical protein
VDAGPSSSSPLVSPRPRDRDGNALALSPLRKHAIRVHVPLALASQFSAHLPPGGSSTSDGAASPR